MVQLSVVYAEVLQDMVLLKIQLHKKFKQYEVNAEQVNEASGILDNTKPSKPHRQKS